MAAWFRTMNQRGSVRRAIRFACEVVRERDFRLIARTALDVSSGGLLVTTYERVLTGEELIVSFRAPGSILWVDAEATVARVIHGRRPEDRGRALGIEFGDIPQDARAYLADGLRGAPPPIPARAPRIDYAATIASL